MASYGRGRSDSFPYRGRGGRGGRGFPPIQYGNNRLIKSDISGIALLKELENNPESLKRVQEILKSNNSGEGSSSSPAFANIVAEQDDNDSYNKKSSCQTILILDNKDLQWKDEPWSLVQRYLGISSDTMGTYKQRGVYESMLKATDSCDIRHFLPNPQAKIYNFSKLIIKQIISVEEWGLNPSSEKEFHNQNILVKYNFWDYKEAFYKTLLYQNPQRKHTWFIKVCPLIYKRKIPNWLIDWWKVYGADENILPEIFLNLFYKWKNVSPAIIEAEFDKSYSHNMTVLHFFCEFGIPWIWRWEPEVSFTHDNIPCLKRIFFIKFWKKMVRLNNEGSLEGQETIDQIQKRISEYEEKIANKHQREALNPFDLIEERIATPNMSKQEQFEKFMEEAKKAILKKLGTDTEMTESSNNRGDTEMFQDSQDPFDLEIDENMAEFYAKMLPERQINTPSNSLSGSSKPEFSNKLDIEEKNKGRRKKGKNRKK